MTRQLKKIALINPKRNLEKQNPKVFELFKQITAKPWFSAPLNLLIIAANTPNDIEITIIDEHSETINFDVQYDLVGLTAMTTQANRAYEIADLFRKKNIPVVMGGIHASVLPNEALQHVDNVFIGESENTWKQFIVDFKNGATTAIYKDAGLFDLSNSITPRYELLNYKQFLEIENYFKLLPVQATRGCPHDCGFCVTSKFYGKKIRKKPIQQVVNEIKRLQELNYDSILLFVDDNLFVDRKYAKELLKAITPLKIRYFAQTDVKVADDQELLELAYNSGCFLMFIGLESIKTTSLENLSSNNWKRKQVDNYKSAIEAIQRNGIVAMGAFVLGFADENMADIDDLKNFVIDSKIPPQFTILTPLPGSDIYNQMKSEDKLYADTFWDQCSFLNLTYKHSNFKKKELEDKVIELYNEVFNDTNSMTRNLHMMQQYKKLPPRWI